MREEIAGLHIGGGFITVAQVKESEGSFNVKQLGWIPYDEDDGGPLCAKLRKAMAAASVSTCTVSCGIRSGSCLVKPFSYPYLRHNELVDALRLEAESSLMLDPDDICFDWHINDRERPQKGTEGGGIVNGVLAAAPRADVEAELAAIRHARLYPVSIEADVVAVANFFLAAAPEESRTPGTCLLHLTPRKVHIAVFYENNTFFPRTISSQGRQTRKTDTIIENIQEDLRYLVYKMRRPEIRQFIIIDDVQGARELKAALEETFGLPAHLWHPFESISIKSQDVEKLQDGPGTQIVTALGLAMHG